VILSELRDYLSHRGSASLADMATRFDTDPEALRPMLARFERKGRVVHRIQPMDGAGGCAGCTVCPISGRCDTAAFELYEWVG
jgi:hypothetical protein